MTGLYMDDQINIQYIKQLVAQNLPIGYVDMDKYEQDAENVYKPYISAFLPANTNFNFYFPYHYSF